MKKIIIFAIISAMMFSAVGCQKRQQEETAFLKNDADIQSGETDEQNTDVDINEPVSEQQTTQPTQTEQTQPQEETVPDYKNIQCKSIAGWQSIRITNDADDGVQLELPSNWVITKNGDQCTISIDSNQIGTISRTRLDAPKEKFDNKSIYDQQQELVRFYQTSWCKQDGQNKMYRDFQFVCEQTYPKVTIYLRVDYEQLDDSACNKIYYEATTVTAFVNTEFVPISNCNGSKNILILGNSFVGTSKVGEFLKDMVKTEGCSVNAVSRGHAKISDYVSDSNICNAIRSGQYCYVFISGFYGNPENVEHFGTLLNICKASNTQLVLFPFHNDSEGYVDEAKVKYTDAIFLDWQGEINKLISSGKVTRRDMCYDDEYGHSTLLAGYVGAHMIYRNMFGKLPPELTNAPLSMNDVSAKLTDYVTTYNKADNSSSFSGNTYVI